MSASHHGESQAQGWGCPTDLLQLRKFVEEAREIWYSKNPIVGRDGSRRKNVPTSNFWVHLEENVSKGVVETVRVRQTPINDQHCLPALQDYPNCAGQVLIITLIALKHHNGQLGKHDWQVEDPGLNERSTDRLDQVRVPLFELYRSERTLFGESYLRRETHHYDDQFKVPFVHRLVDGSLGFIHEQVRRVITLDVYLSERISRILGPVNLMLDRMWQGFEYNEHVNPGVAFYHLRALIDGSRTDFPQDRCRMVEFGPIPYSIVFAEYVESSKRWFHKIGVNEIWEHRRATKERAGGILKYFRSASL